MQLIRQNLAFGQLPSSKGDLYIPTTGRRGYVHNIILHNTNTTAEDVVLNYHDGTSEYEILSENIAADDTLFLDFRGEGEVVDIGGKITGNTTTGSKVTYKFSGTEEIPDAVAGSGGAIQVLWEWNGTDITQFGDGVGTPDYTNGSPNGVLSVGAVPTAVDVPSTNVLLYTTGSATVTAAHFLINDLPLLPERYVIRARVGPSDSAVIPRLICMEQDGTHSVTVGWGGSAGLYVTLSNNSDGLLDGYYVRDSALTQLNAGVVVDIECMAREPSSGVDPRINIIPKIGRGGFEAYGKGGISWTTFGSPPAIYDPSWQSGGTIRKPGVYFYNNGVGSVGWIGELQILSHPWTKEA